MFLLLFFFKIKPLVLVPLTFFIILSIKKLVVKLK